MLIRLLRFLRLRVHSSLPVSYNTQFDGAVHTPKRIALQTGRHCRLGRDVFLDTNEAGRITLGNHVRINQGCVLVSYAHIDIGDDCLIGEYVSIRDANHGTRLDSPRRLQSHASAPIRIGRNVWVGRGAVILKGVTIGDGAVIGANSVVTRDVPAATLVAGAPAKWVKDITE